MSKTLLLAIREYKATVRTKGFILGLVLAPVLMGGGLIAMSLFKDSVDVTDKRIAVVDWSGKVAAALETAAAERNEKATQDGTGKKIAPRYLLEIVEPDAQAPEEQRLELSNRVRNKGLDGFVIIGPGVLRPGANPETSRVAYYSRNPALDETRGWLSQPINDQLRRARLEEAGIDPEHIPHLFRWISVTPLELVERDEATGQVVEPRQANELQAVGPPVALLMFMFLMVMMGAMPLLQSVMEEKSQRVAEVMLGSVRPFEFMMGKILGGVAVSLTGGLVYVIGGAIVIRRMGLSGLFPYSVIPWFFAYMVMAIFMFGAINAALGSACNDSKDAQSLTLPAVLPIMIPSFLLMPMIQSPNSVFATVASLIPLFTPFLMTIRQSLPGGVPGWQPWAGLFGMIVFTLFCIWGAGRVFRVGILLQGKPPNLFEIARWALRG